jgi:predicted lipoprotein with Yx(FWY)xxD motif
MTAWRRRAAARALAPLAAVALLAGCGAGHGSAAGRPSKAQNVLLRVRSVPGLGQIVVTHGWTLYMYPPDRARNVTCTNVGSCLTAWPPLFVTAGHKIVAGPGVKAGLIGSAPGDGGQVVTYDHWPLYYYIGDRKPGEINGQGQGFNWYVIAPDGIPNKKALPLSADGTAGQNGNTSQ